MTHDDAHTTRRARRNLRLIPRQHAANAITLGRLAFLPPLIVAGLLREREIVVALFVAQSALDGVDGWVARRLHIESDLGRRLDSLVDLAVWLPTLALFVWLGGDALADAFTAYPHLFIVPTITVMLMYATAYYYLRRVAAIHLYSGKLTAALLLLLMLSLLLDRFSPLLGYLTAGMGVLYHLEAITIYGLRKQHTDENVTSLWQTLRTRKDDPNEA